MHEIRSCQYLVHNLLVDLALGPHGAILVIFELALAEISHCCIDVNISRTRVKVITAFNISLGQDAKVGDAANVLNGSVQRRMVQE